ncbi:MAG: hypothetical protein E7473_11600, partial [Ruminococcaceae bacterium]|nr:hypothetical protein [Oscillospiraceae bacterium]
MKKNLFSQILSIALALCMAIALLPATALAADETEAGYTLVYDFIDNYAEGVPYTEGETTFFNGGSKNFVDTYEKSNGFWIFHEIETSFSINHCYSTSNVRNNGFRAYFSAGKTWFSIKVKVPVAGTYNVILGYDSDTSFDTECQLYILDGTATKDDIVNSITNGTNLIGSVNCTNGKQNGQQKTTVGSKALSAGEYVVVFRAANAKNIRVHDLRFVSGDGSLKTPMLAEMNVSKNEIEGNGIDTAIVSVSKLHMSDATLGTSDDIAAITFASSDEEIATVSGTTVTGISAGDVKIYAKAGDRVIGEADITVKGKAPVVINFANGAITGTNGSSSDTWTVTDNAFSIVPEKTKSGDGTMLSGYVTISGYALAKIHTGWLEWPANSVANTSFTIKKNFKYPGYYSVKLLGSVWNANSQYALYINGEYAGDYNFYNSASSGQKLGSENTLNTIYVPAGDVEISFRTRHRYYSGGYSLFSPITLTLTPAEEPAISAVETSIPSVLEVDASAELTAKVKMTDGTYRQFGYTDAGVVPEDNNIVKVESSAPQIVSVSDVVCVKPSIYQNYTQTIDPTTTTYKLTALNPGDATITVTAIVDGKTTTSKTTINVPDNAPGEAVSDTVKVYIGATTGGSVTADKVSANTVADAEAGTKITAEATANEGYKFAYWKDSAGNVVSDSEEYTFNAYTNTSIVAVFDNASEENETIGVEFFDGNRDFLGFVSADAGTEFKNITAPPANLTGYEFTGWSIEDNAIINGILRAVALYKEEGNAVSGVKVNGSAKTDTKYDDAITETVEGAKAWYRDEKLVGYGDTYTYYVWGATSITSSDVEVTEKLPIAVLNTSGDAYMLEYDSAGYEIVDAGILFGDDTHNTVNACYYKAKVKNIKA